MLGRTFLQSYEDDDADTDTEDPVPDSENVTEGEKQIF